MHSLRWLVLAAAATVFPTLVRAQVCTGVPVYEGCLDAIAGRAEGVTTPRDPMRIIDGIFRTSDTPPRYAPELTFATLVTERSVFNYPSCMAGVSLNPRMYTANSCSGPIPVADVGGYVNSLDWRFSVTARVYSDGAGVADGDPCGGDRARCGYEAPWASAYVMDLQGPSNRVVVFPITDHVTDSCLEAFEYSVYLTDNPASREFVGWTGSPDPMRWNPAVLVRAFTRGWTNNAQSTGTVADMAVHPLEMSPDGEAVSDSIATVWSLPCGVTFRYVALVPGNYGSPDGRCAFHSSEYEYDAIAGLNEDGTVVCVDRDADGFRDRACGGNDCDDRDPMVNPGAIETCSSTRDLNCDGARSMCPAATTCLNGLCVPGCVEGGCATGFRCVAAGSEGSFCVPNACVGMSCPAGQVCGPAGCQDPCTGARCPTGQVCRGGACADPCAGVECPTRQHCEAGRCAPNCPCVTCPTGRSCNERTGRCEAPSCGSVMCPANTLLDCTGETPRCVARCEGVTCPLGARCEMTTGRCVPDRCSGVSCPGDARCVEGTCVRPMMMDAAVDVATVDVITVDVIAVDVIAADVPPDMRSSPADVLTVDVVARDVAKDVRADANLEVASDTGGCGCRVGSTTHTTRGMAAFFVALIAMGSRRKRVRRVA
jgi:hypothetical protein